MEAWQKVDASCYYNKDMSSLDLLDHWKSSHCLSLKHPKAIQAIRE